MQPYSIITIQNKQNGILFNSPHSGVYLPKNFLKKISIIPSLLAFSSDRFMDQLISDTPLFGATAFFNHYSRSYVDTNRTCREIDPDMFQTHDHKNAYEYSNKVACGFGTFFRKAYNGLDIYSEKLPASEITHRMTEVYYPVHNALSLELETLYLRHGFYILIDCHSMPSYHFISPVLSHTKQPDLIIGNCFGKSCSDEITQFIHNYFKNLGFNIELNQPYSGGFNTKHYGKYERQKNNRQAIQLEFNRALYMNEQHQQPNEGFPILHHHITGLSQSLADQFGSIVPA